ncbi:MAG: aminotransferase class V-fold PLP-dependent enzyme [Bacteroidia bacterium]
MQNDLALFISLANELIEKEEVEPVVEPIDPDHLYEKLDLTLGDEPMVDEEFAESLRQLVLATPRTASKKFYNQLFGGRNSKAVLGDLIAVMLNNSMYTYKVAGPQVGVEKEIIHRSCDLAGYPKQSDGTIAAGGSMTNLMAMLMARDHGRFEITRKGVNGKMTLYTSEDSHYSIPKNASFIGVGLEQVRYIPTNSRGEMLVKELEEAIVKDQMAGYTPFFVNATAGTTVLGSFDPIAEISSICTKHGLWLHVDGAYCGSVIFSEKYKRLIKGLELSDSFSYNAHKMLGTPLTCSIIITQHRKALYDSFSIDADYLYQTDKDDFNLGKTSLQCGRRNDALKFWTLWKAIGLKGLEELVNKQFELADFAREYVINHPDYTFYSFEDSVSICFNYKNVPANELCTAMYKDSKTLVGFGEFRGQEFVRLVTINPGNSKEDLLEFFKTLETYTA